MQEKWEEFRLEGTSVFQIDSLEPHSTDELYQTWLSRHKFWYEDLPNELYEKCLNFDMNSINDDEISCNTIEKPSLLILTFITISSVLCLIVTF